MQLADTPPLCPVVQGQPLDAHAWGEMVNLHNLKIQIEEIFTLIKVWREGLF